jgi:DUF438 domain-containing protein
MEGIGEMSTAHEELAKLEARLRALEAIVQAVPQVFTQDVFERVEQNMRRRYDHPLAVTDQPRTEIEKLESEALNEIWREMSEAPVV